MSLLLFDDARAHPARAWRFPEPVREILARTPAEVEAALAEAEAARAAGYWLAGYAAYELGYVLEPRLAPLVPASRPGPLMRWAVCRAPDALTAAAVEQLLADAGAEAGAGAAAGPPAVEVSARPLWDEAAYTQAFARVQQWITAGDVYQVNLSFPLEVDLRGAPAALFARLRQKARAAYGALLDFGDEQILSVSPELFLEIAGGRVRTRPMKGTVARAAGLEEDAAARERLRDDVKQQAENLMIVDLLRNDLTRIARPGSVRVDDLFTVETYPSLHTMTSGVSAELDGQPTIAGVLRALFPCGSVTGAPKIRAMEIIRALEPQARGVYCGAIGWFAPDGGAVLNVAIRTLRLAGGRGVWRVGAGLVHDSQAPAEYRECLLKARVLTDAVPPFGLLATMRWQDGRLWLRERHIARLAASAAYWQFPWDEADLRARLAAAMAGLDDAPRRVRAVLWPTGRLEVTHTPLDPWPFAGLDPQAWPAGAPAWRVGISAVPQASTNPHVRHKTTLRDHYDGPFAAAQAHGLDEVLFTNERGELTEGSRTSLVVERDGRWLTPPLACGAIDGVLRRELMAAGRLVEAVLRPEDLAPPARLWLGNAVRGLVPGVLVAREAIRSGGLVEPGGVEPPTS